MRVPHPGQGHLVLIIFLSLMQEWRGDYGGMVLYLNDQRGILRLQAAALRT
jgi:hypothetical protein